MIKNPMFIVCLELQRQVDQFFMSQVMQREINIDISTKDYPKVYLSVSTESQEVCVPVINLVLTPLIECAYAVGC